MLLYPNYSLYITQISCACDTSQRKYYGNLHSVICNQSDKNRPRCLGLGLCVPRCYVITVCLTMKSLQSAVDCTPKKKRSTLEVTTSRNKRLERSLQCARSKVPYKWKMVGANQAQKISSIAWPLDWRFFPWGQSYP